MIKAKNAARFLRRHGVKIAAGAAAVAVAAAVALPQLASAPASAAAGYAEQAVQRRDITAVYTGAGMLEAAASYTVRALVSGTVLTDDFEVGDTVQKGDVLYTIDSSEAQAEAEKAQLSLNEAERSAEAAREAQTVRSPIAGTVSEFYVQAGDTVTAGQQVAAVCDSSTVLLALDFPAADAAGFAVGQAAQVTLDGTFEVLSGTVQAVAGASTLGGGNLAVCSVTIAVPNNNGALTQERAAMASVNGVASLGSAHFAYRQRLAVTAQSGGTVEKLCVKQGGAVSANSELLTLGGQALEQQEAAAQDTVRSAQLSLEAAQRRVENYTITAPVSGTVVRKNVKAGDTVGTADADSGGLCAIYDMSSLTMELNVDELKILSLAVGQQVNIVADALPNDTYTGTITSVLYAGTTQNGTTTYPVTVRVDDTGSLRPGMNAAVSITTADVKNVLAVPVEALLRGGYVLVTAQSPSAANADASMQAPEGYAYVAVTTGVSDDGYIEITSGLQAGDTIAYDPAAAQSSGGEEE